MHLGLIFGLGVRHNIASAFSPDGLDGLALWADASDLTTITQTGGGVSQWADKSGHGRHLVQSTASLQPHTGSHTQNGLNVLACDGSTAIGLPSLGTLDSLSNGGETSLYVVFRSDHAMATQRLFIEQGPTRYGLLLLSGRVVGRHHTSTANQAWASLYSAGSAHIATMTRTGSSVAARLDSGSFANAAANSFVSVNEISATGRNNSAGQDLNGWIAEIILYSRALTLSEDIQILTYLKNKWNTV